MDGVEIHGEGLIGRTGGRDSVVNRGQPGGVLSIILCCYYLSCFALSCLFIVVPL